MSHLINVCLILDLEQEEHSKGDCITQLISQANQRPVRLLRN